MQPHLPALDGLRAFAIALVLWQHAGILFAGRGLDVDSPFWRASRAGWWGVDLFFVLSGFLITRGLVHTAQAPGAIGAFWRRRAARTLPLLYVYLMTAAAYGLGGGFPVGEQPWAAYVTHTANWHIAWNDFGLPIFGMLWSLGVEEQFYVAWPLAARVAKGRLLGVSLALLAAAPLARWGVYHLSDCYASFHVLPFCRADTLAMGAALALFMGDPGRRALVSRIARVALAPALACLAVVTALGLGPWPMERFEEVWVVFGYSAVGLSCTVLVGLAASGSRAMHHLFGNAPMGLVGKVSYGVYLWHCLAAHVLLDAGWSASVGQLLGAWLVLVGALATASWIGIERPWLGRRSGVDRPTPVASV